MSIGFINNRTLAQELNVERTYLGRDIKLNPKDNHENRLCKYAIIRTFKSHDCART